MGKSFGIIYKATNVVNGKCYIGRTIQKLELRKDGISYKKISVKMNIPEPTIQSWCRKIHLL